VAGRTKKEPEKSFLGSRHLLHSSAEEGTSQPGKLQQSMKGEPANRPGSSSRLQESMVEEHAQAGACYAGKSHRRIGPRKLPGAREHADSPPWQNRDVLAWQGSG